jgi:pSer/pThr/pTyr-binding forkhead associated (FHA) protein
MTLELQFPATSQTLRVPLNKDKFIIGRSSGVDSEGPDIDLAPYDAAHQGVSRYHASLTCRGDTLVIKDLESLNHTHINGLRLFPYEARVLRNEDVLMLGKLVMHVNLEARDDLPSQPG